MKESSPIGPVLVNECKQIKLNEETWKKILDKIKGPHRLTFKLLSLKTEIQINTFIQPPLTIKIV